MPKFLTDNWMKFVFCLSSCLLLSVATFSLSGCGADDSDPTEFVDSEEDEYWDDYDYDEPED